jgi:hypothetical protein
MFRHYGIDIDKSAPAGSFLQWMEQHSDCPRRLAPLDEEAQTKAMDSANAFLARKWVREKTEALFGTAQTASAP